jgi:hypothetical protein
VDTQRGVDSPRCRSRSRSIVNATGEGFS